MTSIRFGLQLTLMMLGAAAMAGPAIDQGAAVPASLLQRPGADTCPALRSGTYRLVTPTLGGTLVDQTGKMELDAGKLTIIRPDGGRGTWEAKGNCRFVEVGSDGFSVDYVVSQAGILVGRITVNGGSSYRNVLGFPEQAHALAELAGTWNTIGLGSAPGGLHAVAGIFSYDRAGLATSVAECGNPATWATDVCTDLPGPALADHKPFVADAAGGFVSRNGTHAKRLFLYRAATGQPLLVLIESDGAFHLGTPAEALVAPAVGRSTAAWNLDMTGQLASATSTYDSSFIVVAIDPSLREWTRARNPGLPDERLERMLINSPRGGYVTRPAGETTSRSGSTVRFNEFTMLVLPGTGVVGLVLPKIKLFEFSVQQP